MHLDKNNKEELTAYLRRVNLLSAGEELTGAEKAGEGNMNYTLRIRTADRSFILKQARPYVEKYPSIPAPVERAAVESAFFRLANTWPAVSNMLPRLLYFDPENHIQAIEDLGEGSDFTLHYNRDNPFPAEAAEPLIRFLNGLHTQSRLHPPATGFSNRAMRELNHLHIFDFPFRADNGLNLDDIRPGLKAVAGRTVHRYPELHKRALALGARYLAEGDTLLHGDYFPGSWLQTGRGLFIIDPEFCFLGEPAFDLGVCLAHFSFCGLEWENTLALFDRHYGDFDRDACRDFAAVEILRRVYGVAQLPLDLDLKEIETLTIRLIDHFLGGR